MYFMTGEGYTILSMPSELFGFIIGFQRMLRGIKSCFEDNTYLNNIWNKAIDGSLALMTENILRGHVVDSLHILKFIIEAAVQSLYLFVKNEGDEETIWRELRLRGKHATSFSVRMIINLPNTPGLIKKDMRRVYVEIAKYSHPTYEILRNTIILAAGEASSFKMVLELTKQALDYVAYLALRICKLRSCLMHPELSIESIHNYVCSMQLKRACKYVGKITRK